MNILAPLQDEMWKALTLVIKKHKQDQKESRLVAGSGWAIILAACILGLSLATGGAVVVGAGAVLTGSSAAGGLVVGATVSGVPLAAKGQSRLNESKRKGEELEGSKSKPDTTRRWCGGAEG